MDEFNGMPEEAARHALRDCCSAGRWIDAVAAGRPYPSMRSLLGASDAAVAALGEADLREALAGHPRIGDRRVVDGPAAGQAGGAGEGEAAGWSMQEQAGVSGADAELRQALADGNVEYEQRFGHIYLACATGRSAAELLAFLRERLGNDRETEWRVVASELAKINQIRLRKLTGGAGAGA
ncbi:MAG TPA: 2-oxo-4-hydroxy-4-carboxy-5-ureidoimidazoline decarboxylase [Streptosporangiaceae bacterium]|nr:2-oxo-4-hydroxy-4-carboxy-5-ureidoimidazoline decarboxylase [Streptosporangiaceae bacterium]